MSSAVARSEKVGVGIATSNGTGTDLANLSTFTLNDNGIWMPCANPSDPTSCANGDLTLFAVQTVPLSSGKMRMYFEASDVSLPGDATRIYSLDSQDGLTGLDFNRGTATSCGGFGSRDYASGGDCEPTLEINAGSGSAAAVSGLTNARQFKIGYPQLNDWRWDGSLGTFMAITGADACGKTSNGLFLASLDSSGWNVLKDSVGCATPLVEKAHGPVVVHLGGARYKLYYEDESNGHNGKPFKVIYANGKLSGAAETVEFADWEVATQARDVTFLWPDGSVLSAEEESGLGDHMVLLPNDDLDTQYIYVNLGGFDNADWNNASSGLGVAVLINP